MLCLAKDMSKTVMTPKTERILICLGFGDRPYRLFRYIENGLGIPGIGKPEPSLQFLVIFFKFY